MVEELLDLLGEFILVLLERVGVLTLVFERFGLVDLIVELLFLVLDLMLFEGLYLESDGLLMVVEFRLVF